MWSMFPSFLFGLVLALVGGVSAKPAQRKASRGLTSTQEHNGARVTVFEHSATESKLEYVTNSGICETTPNVKQYSGYLSVGENMNMWFWFFESRRNPETAPLIAWFNGGPGCSSMIGLFQVLYKTPSLLAIRF